MSTNITAIIDSVHGLILNNLPLKSGKTPSGWVTMNCPMCSDKRRRGGVITQGPKISYHCFNCKFKTGWQPGLALGKKYKSLATTLGVDQQELHAVQIQLMKHSDDLELQDSSEYVFKAASFPTVELPENVQAIETLPDSHELKLYAKERGILGAYPLLHFDDIFNKRRVIIPFTYNNELVGWSGRHIAPPDKNTPKYLNKMPHGYVFNIDRYADTERDVVIVTEGIMDAILVDGVALLTNAVSTEQAQLINRLNKRVILCPDRDEPGKQLIEQALALDWEVSFPPWHAGVKDAADACDKYGRLLTVASIIQYATSNKIKAKVQTKLL